MMKKIFICFFAVMLAFGIKTVQAQDSMPASNTVYTKQLSKTERQNICSTLKNKKYETKTVSINNDIVPNSVFDAIYSTVEKIYLKVANISVLGDALMCHATHAGQKNLLKIGNVKIFKYPDFGIWLCGFIIYFSGFMLLLAIAFYIIDISFKLGIAVVLLPIGIALWPFEWTKDKLSKLISIILKSAGIFIFLALSASYALNMLSASVGGIGSIFDAINKENTDFVSKHFTLWSTSFLIILTSLIYGKKLIASTTKDYVDKFFPDAVFGGGGGAYPMHYLSTQAIDFAKKKVVAPVASFAGDVTMTQAGKLTAAAGRGINNVANKLTNASSPAPKNTMAGFVQRASRGILLAPGTLLERVGGAMQDHKGPSAKGVSYAQLKREEEEEKKRAAEKESQDWKEPD